MKTLLLALLGAFFMTSAQAADWPVVTDRDGTHTKAFTRMSGGQVTLDSTTTHDVATWGFSSSAVRICFREDFDESGPLYMRIGTAISATSSAYFIDGGGDQGADPAAVLSPGGDGTDSRCEIYPLKVRGLVFHTTAAGATIDVQALD